MIRLLLLIVLVGVGLWVVETYVPMSPPIRVILRAVAVIFLLLVLLRFFGVWV